MPPTKTAPRKPAKRATGGRKRTVPQAAAAPKPADQTDSNQEWRDLIDEATSADGEYAPASIQIKRAIDLEREMAEVRVRVNDNRDYLRLMKKNKAVTEAQGDFIDTWFPEKERGERRDKDEIEATRKLREVARRDGNS
jgi:hypothetical protein